MTETPRRQRWKFVALVRVIGSVLFFLILLEVGLRLTGFTPEVRPYEFDAELGWEPKRSFAGYRSTPWYAHFVYFNADGFATTEEHLMDGADRSVPAIALIGDSYVEGYSVPYEASFAHLVDQATQGRQVINLGVAGYAPEQYLLRARRRLPGFLVTDVVVVLFPENDLAQLDKAHYEDYETPRFGENLDHPLNTPLKNIRAVSREEPLVKTLARSTAIYTVARPLLRGHVAPLEEQDLRDPAEESRFFTEDEFRRALKIIGDIQRTVPEARLHITYMPTPEEFVQDAFRANKRVFLEICASKALSCHVPGFFDQVDESNLETYFIDPARREQHLTEYGSVKYAEFLLDVLGTG